MFTVFPSSVCFTTLVTISYPVEKGGAVGYDPVLVAPLAWDSSVVNLANLARIFQTHTKNIHRVAIPQRDTTD